MRRFSSTLGDVLVKTLQTPSVPVLRQRRSNRSKVDLLRTWRVESQRTEPLSADQYRSINMMISSLDERVMRAVVVENVWYDLVFQEELFVFQRS